MNKSINKIQIKNFKSIKSQVIDGCKRINVFIGSPNVGKSNILEALGLYSILLTSKKEFFYFDEICRVKHLSELYFNQNYRNDIEVKLNNRFSLSGNNGQNTSILNFEFSDSDDLNHFAGEFKSANPPYSIPLSEQDNVHSASISYRIYSEKIENWPINPIKKYHFVSNSPVHLINDYPLSIPDGKNLLDVLQREAELRKGLAKLLAPYGLKLLLDKSAESIMLIKELDDSSLLRIPYHQVADTLRRLFFYKTAIASNKKAVLLFEEPEAHMFPPYIGNFTADIIKDKNANQYFLTTHSPFVINDFLEDAMEDLSVYVVYYKNGETKINHLTKQQLHEIYQFGVDIFLNIEDYLNNG